MSRLLAATLGAVLGLGAAFASAAPAILISNAQLLDVSSTAPLRPMNVLVEDGKISRVVPAELPLAAPPGAMRIDGQGGVLMPGLMDVHVHLAGGTKVSKEGLRAADLDYAAGTRALHSYLYAGVTTIYDAGNNPDFIFTLRTREREGELVAPRILATGGIVTYPGSHGSFEGATLIDRWPEGAALADAHIARAPDMVKFTYEERGWGLRPMIPMLPLELLRTLAEYWNDHGIRSTVHVSGEKRAREAIFAGVDTLSHPVIQGPVSDNFVKLMAARRIPMASTLTIGENYSRLAEHPEFLDEPLYKDTLTPEQRKDLLEKTRPAYAKDQWTWWMKLMTPVAQENLRRIDAAGGIVALGTDQTNGAAVHRELELLVAAGITPRQAIRIGTLNAARFLGQEETLGSITEGKIADMVLLDADPSTDIRNARRIRAVLKDGVLIDRSRLQLPVNAR
jgi:imidazolonepropionase-like amidohydrolase